MSEAPQTRREFIKAYITEHGPVDTMMSDFVYRFAGFSHAMLQETMVGPPRCPALNRELSAMFRDGELERFTVGVPQAVTSGLPKWVYGYRLAHDR